eukprot:9758431-Karenia_brevis.AAC.1
MDTYVREREQLQVGGWMEVVQGPELPPPTGWLVSTDGSGQQTTQQGNKVSVAGWGVIIFRLPLTGHTPDYVLHAPVVTAPWHPQWVGARERTNNTGELTAVIEAMMWLRDEAPDNGDIPVLFRFDSYYAANIAQGIWEPKSNEELAEKAREITSIVEGKRQITWQHVYGHSGEHDNELADRAADLGAKGRVSNVSKRWTQGTAESPAIEYAWNEFDWCRKCGEKVPIQSYRVHSARCTPTANAIPDNIDKCRKCMKIMARG